MKQFYRSLHALLAMPAIALIEPQRRQLEAMIGQLPRRRVRHLPNPPMANLSRRHPDFGLSPQEHASRKAKRARVIGVQPGL